MSKSLLYYTGHRHAEEIEQACRVQLDKARGSLELIAVSLKPIDFGDVNVVIPLEPSKVTMTRQILDGLYLCDPGAVFLCENDVLYHPSHFDFEPALGSVFWYNTNVWRVRYADGHAVWTDDLQQTSGLCADRDLLVAHYRGRLALMQGMGFDGHYEPGPKTSKHAALNWQSRWPNLDIRHDGTLTRSKWSPGEFRNPYYARGWSETDDLPGWGPGRELMDKVRSGNYGAK